MGFGIWGLEMRFKTRIGLLGLDCEIWKFELRFGIWNLVLELGFRIGF